MKMSPFSRRKPLAALLGAGLAILSQPVQAQTVYTWLGNTDADISTAANWNPTLSVAATSDNLVFGGTGSSGTLLNYNRTTQIGSSGTAMFFNASAAAYSFSGTTISIGGSGIIQNDSANTQTFGNAISVGNGSFRANSGALLFNGPITWGANGTLTLAGSAGLTFASSATGGVLTVGTSTSAVLNINGNTTTTASAANGGVLNVGVGSANGNGTINIATGGLFSILGTTNATKQNSILGSSGGTGAVNVNGGSLAVGENTGFIIGNNTNSTGTLNINSGNVTINAGSFTTGTDKDFAVIMMGKDAASASGTINLNGGVLATDRQFVRGRGNSSSALLGNAVFNFNGGTLQALSDQSDWFSGTVNSGSYALTSVTVQENGAIIDSNTFAIAINNAMTHSGTAATDGGLTKIGSGALTLGAASTYNGDTTITAGTLLLGAAGSIDDSASVGVNAGAAFNTTAKTTYAMLGDQPFVFTLDPASGGSAGMLVAAGLDITNGVVDFSTLGALDDSVYIIASYTSLTGGSFATVNNLPGGYSVDYDYLGGNQIALVLVPEPGVGAMFVLGLGGLIMLQRLRRGRTAR